jgi:hypothetical protein
MRTGSGFDINKTTGQWQHGITGRLQHRVRPVKTNCPLFLPLISSNLAIFTLAAKPTPPYTQSVFRHVHTEEPIQLKVKNIKFSHALEASLWESPDEGRDNGRPRSSPVMGCPLAKQSHAKRFSAGVFSVLRGSQSSRREFLVFDQ